MRDDGPPIPAALVDDEPEWYTSDLDEAILVGQLPEFVEGTEAYGIASRGQAEWAMRKLAAVLERTQEAAQLAAGWRGRIDEWEKAELARVAPARAYFAGLLEQYGREQREANPREATISLPSGKIATQKPKTPVTSVVDEEALLRWLANEVSSEVYEQVVRANPHVLIAELRKVVDVQLELAPWCQVCGAALTFATGTGGVTHAIPDNPEFDVDNEYDHDARPGATYVARFEGKEVAGVRTELGDVTARVNVDR